MQLCNAALDTSRLRCAGLIAAAAVLCGPIAASAASHRDASAARKAPAPGVAFGGTTSQDFPIVIETARKGKQVARATVAVRMTCTAGGFFTAPDFFERLTVSKSRKFGASFGPETLRNDDGTTTDFEGSMSGRFNSSRTRVAGKWAIKATFHDAAGAVTDTCDSGSISWSAKQ